MKIKQQCECSDPGCKSAMHAGFSTCSNSGRIVLYRVDMEDQTGTLFCSACAGDAMESGLFDGGDSCVHGVPTGTNCGRCGADGRGNSEEEI